MDEASLRSSARRVRRYVRAACGRDLWVRPQVRVTAVRLGSSYGGWSILPELLGADSLVYSFGVGNDISWDLAMIDRFDLVAHAFDPTPRSVRWVGSQQLPRGLSFHPLGIADFDGTANFVLRNSNPAWCSYNLSDDTEGAYETAVCDVRRFETIVRELDHQGRTMIDVVKLDVEGAEFAVIDDILGGMLRPRQLLIEFHYLGMGKPRLQETSDAIAKLNNAGYKIFSRSPVGCEFGFVLA